MEKILNEILTWDGAHLGVYPETAIIYKEKIYDREYCCIQLTDGRVYGMLVQTKNMLPCIIDELRPLFNIERRGLHRIKLNRKEYVIYYTPLSTHEKIIPDLPLNKIDKPERLRKEIQNAIVFCDVLSLANTGIQSLRVRDTKVFNINDINTTVTRPNQIYDYSIISGPLFNKWFGEQASLTDICWNMICPNIINENADETHIVLSSLRSAVQNVINKYDPNYIWLSYFIIDRLRRRIQ